MRLSWAGEPTLVYHAGWLSAAKPGFLLPRLSVNVAAVSTGPAYEHTGLNRPPGSIQQCFCEELSAASDFGVRRLTASIFLLIA